MTLQAVPPLADPLMLATAFAVVGFAAAGAVQLVRGRRRPGARLLLVAAGLLAAYGVVLAGAGLLSRPVDLAPGDAKCFDDWCVVMVSAHRDPASNSLLADLRVENHGRGRAMRSDLARAYLELGDRQVAPIDSAPLHVMVGPGSAVPAELAFPLAGGGRARLVVVEDGGGGLGPGTFELGGDSSAFHARAGWTV